MQPHLKINPQTTQQAEKTVFWNRAALSEWDVFVLRHQSRANLAVHVLSFAMFWGSPVAALMLKNHWLWIGFFASGFVGSAGHYFFDDGTVDGREATSRVDVVLFSSFACFFFLTGRYHRFIAISQKKIALHLSGHLASEVDALTLKKIPKLETYLQSPLSEVGT